jgi:DNA polymerase-3 subunit alpha
MKDSRPARADRAAFDRYGPDAAEEMLKSYIARFAPEFYLEIMLLDFKKQRAYDEWLVKMHRKYGVPMIVSQDCHYCRKEDSQQQRYMLMIRGKKTIKDFENIEDGADYFELQDTNLWLKSEDELDEKYWKRETDGFSYSDIIPPEVYTQAKRNTVVVAQKASGVEIDRSVKLPQIPNADERFKEAAIKGYAWRGLGKSPKYINRLREEVELITRKGFSSYFMIQQQICDEARRVCPQLLGWGKGDEAIGPGRGSAVGSLVCYCLGIIDVDPIKHDLLFSRFLSESRGAREMKTRFTNVPIPEDF